MIHPTATVSKNAHIDETCYIGPYCIVGENVNLGKKNKLISHVTITGNTLIKDENTFFPFSSIGSEPQDLKYDQEISYLNIGSKNKFRENVTVNPGTKGGGLKTTIKDNCLFMVGSHIAHDCKIESNVIMANNATLAGHVEINNHAILGGNCAVHQFVRIGEYAMIGGMSGVEKDIIPYGLYTGIRENLKGINLIGLKRKGLDTKSINEIYDIVKILFNKKDTITNNIKSIETNNKFVEINKIIEFIRDNSKRGLCIIEDE